MNFIESLQTKDQVTQNGMPTNSTSLNRCVDLFFSIGAMRGQDNQKILNKFIKAFEENRTIALRIVFWCRDVRGGAGERNIFRIIWSWLCINHPEIVNNNLSNVDFLGRWDDHFCGLGTESEKAIIERLKVAIIEDKNQLAAKWMPRKGKIANILRKKFGLSPKEYRKLLVENTNVVESKMCANDWTNIEYDKLPSLAISRNKNAFKKHDSEGFSNYVSLLEKGEKKINASAVYPYDIIKSMLMGEENHKICEQQWNTLPNYMEDCYDYVLPVVDVSGSMHRPIGGNKNLTAIAVAVSLGLYISQRNIGQFKDYFMTFSEVPELVHTSGTLHQRFKQMSSSNWGMNTNLIRMFDTILKHARTNNVKACDMPTKIIIFSDMEFDECIKNPKNSAIESIRQTYEEYNYTLPKIVFWNILSSGNNVPVRYDEHGTALVSGFSPSILKSLLNMKISNPYAVMMDTINNVRYSEIFA